MSEKTERNQCQDCKSFRRADGDWCMAGRCRAFPTRYGPDREVVVPATHVCSRFERRAP